MKKLWIALALLLLCGCAAEQRGRQMTVSLPEPAEDPIMEDIRQTLQQPGAKLGDMTEAWQVTGQQGLWLRYPVIGERENEPLAWVDIRANWDKEDRPVILGWEKTEE